MADQPADQLGRRAGVGGDIGDAAVGADLVMEVHLQPAARLAERQARDAGGAGEQLGLHRRHLAADVARAPVAQLADAASDLGHHLGRRAIGEDFQRAPLGADGGGAVVAVGEAGREQVERLRAPGCAADRLPRRRDRLGIFALEQPHPRQRQQRARLLRREANRLQRRPVVLLAALLAERLGQQQPAAEVVRPQRGGGAGGGRASLGRRLGHLGPDADRHRIARV